MAQSEKVNGVKWTVRLTDGRFAHLFLPGSPAVVFSREFDRGDGPPDGLLEITETENWPQKEAQ